MVISILRKLCSVIPTWKIIPTKDIVDAAFKLPEVRQQVYFFPNFYY
jgi:acylglycerol lipase